MIRWQACDQSSLAEGDQRCNTGCDQQDADISVLKTADASEPTCPTSCIGCSPERLLPGANRVSHAWSAGSQASTLPCKAGLSDGWCRELLCLVHVRTRSLQADGQRVRSSFFLAPNRSSPKFTIRRKSCHTRLRCGACTLLTSVDELSPNAACTACCHKTS